MNKKEIRDILLGRIVRVDEKLWAAAPADARFHFHGVKDGAGDVRLFGVTHLSRSYQPEGGKPAAALADAEPALNSMGRPMLLESMPEKKACLYAPGWIAPVLLTLEAGKDDLQMTAYTGRSLFLGRLRCRIALWILSQRLPARAAYAGDDGRAEETNGEKKGNVPTGQPRKAETGEKTGSEEKAKSKAKTAPRRLKKKTAPRRLKK